MLHTTTKAIIKNMIKTLGQTPGEVAYNAYCATRDWKSVRGEPLPKFSEQTKELQVSWETAAQAAIQFHKTSEENSKQAS